MAGLDELRFVLDRLSIFRGQECVCQKVTSIRWLVVDFEVRGSPRRRRRTKPLFCRGPLPLIVDVDGVEFCIRSGRFFFGSELPELLGTVMCHVPFPSSQCDQAGWQSLKSLDPAQIQDT